jgi:S-adenosylmethionine:tRNA ribosyltransferase-isomerase
MMVVHRKTGQLEHRQIGDLLQYLRPKDVLVLNDSRVIHARLRGINPKTGGQLELLLLEENGLNDWWAMVRPGKRAREGTQIAIKDTSGNLTPIRAVVTAKNAEGHGRLSFAGVTDILDELSLVGEVPLPPYINRIGGANREQDGERYQTVFARTSGSVAAPTAGLHFTEDLLQRIREMGVEVCFVTLHVGLGTFAPVKSGALEEHVMHEERYEIDVETVKAVTRAKSAGGRVVAVGTTSLRLLESVARQAGGELVAGKGRTRIFIYPPFEFKAVDVLLTNFHLPKSTLIMLVSAFAAPGQLVGRERILGAYAEAIRNRYRFYSYGDAMLIL